MALGSYRSGFIQALERTGADVVILTGDEHFNHGVVTDVTSPLITRTGPNVFVLGRRVGWQRGCLGAGVSARSLVIELNPRNLTSWLLLGIRRLLGRPTAGWGHAHSRRGPAPAANRSRRIMQKLCSDLVAYTSTEAADLARLFPGSRVLVAFNSLYSRDDLAPFTLPPTTDRTDLILIGRLVPDKKPLLGITGFARAVAHLPSTTTLHVVGSGPEEHVARAAATRLGVQDRVRFHGHRSDLDDVGPLFLRCRGLLAPGYVGLNATQALAFGLVVLHARDEPHAPEIEALDRTNSIDFESDSAEACADAIVRLFDDERTPDGGSRDTARYDPQSIADRAAHEYTTDRMIEPFLELAR